MPHGKRIAELLIDIGAVKLSIDPPFTWSSGIKSPIYCDNRMMLSHPDAREVVVTALVSRVKTLHVQPDLIAGEGGAIPWATLVADRLNLPLVYLRKKAKEHGMKKRIEGDLPEGKDVVVIEDLISTGGSSINTVNALREEGKAKVSDVVAIFTYEKEESLEKAAEMGIKFHPVADFTTLLDVALEQGRLNNDEVKMVAGFIKNPLEWAA